MRALRTLVALVTVGGGFVATSACSLIEVPNATDPAGGTGGAGHGECTVNSDCPPSGTDCIVSLCDEGRCGFAPAPNLQPLTIQAPGDCATAVCDGEGGEVSVNANDPFDNGNPCTQGTCDNGVPMQTATPNQPCPEGFCSEEGVCVECLDAMDCQGDNVACDQGLCVPLICTNDSLDGQETDIDCGGPECAPCMDDEMCVQPSDCVSLVCTGGICQPPSCKDGALNGTESDEDCGGDDCDPCPVGSGCNSPSDCVEGVCANLQCQGPSCSDGIKNGDESDKDCGGSCNAGCADGKACNVSEDCLSAYCNVDSLLCEPPSCTDGLQNGSEAGVDCGGGDCLGCAGDPCDIDGDCASGLSCCAGVTPAPQCQLPTQCD